MRYLHLLRDAYGNSDSRTRLRWGMGVALLLLVAVLLSAVSDRAAKLDQKRKRREAELTELMILKQRYLEAKSVSQMFTNRLATAKSDDNPAKLIEEIGIKGKSARITPVKGEERGGFIEDAAEVKLEGLTANEAINLLYRLEKGARPVIVKKASFKSRFDDPAKLDLTMTIALLKPAPQGSR